MLPVENIRTYLILSPPPVVYPFPVLCPEALSKSSAHQQLAPHLTPTLLRAAPLLADLIIDDFLDLLDKALVDAGRNEPFSTSLTTAIEREIDAISHLVFASYSEDNLFEILSNLARRVLDPLVSELEQRLGRSGPGVIVPGAKQRLPPYDAHGRQHEMTNPRTGLIPDVTFMRNKPHNDSSVRNITRVHGLQYYVYITGEQKTPQASEPSNSTSDGGMFVRFNAELLEAGEKRLDELTDPQVKSLLKKAVASARIYNNASFFLTDLLSFVWGRIHLLDDVTFEILLSPLPEVATTPPSNTAVFIVLLLSAFFPDICTKSLIPDYRDELATCVSASSRPTVQPALEGGLSQSSESAASSAPRTAASTRRTRSGAAALRRQLHDSSSEEVLSRTSEGNVTTPISLVEQKTPAIPLRYPNGFVTWLTSTIPPPDPFVNEQHIPPLSSSIDTFPTRALTSPPLGIPTSSFPAPSADDVATAPGLQSLASIELSSFVDEGFSSRAYRFSNPSKQGDPNSLIFKIALEDADEELEHETAVLLGPLEALTTDAVSVLGVFKRADGRFCVVMEDGGEAPDEWPDLSLNQRISLMVSLFRIHQVGGVMHNDITPRNVVAQRASPAHPLGRPKWIDWAHCGAHASCDGARCPELAGTMREMGLREASDVEEVKERVHAAGLMYE
ncbi:uncharacterized protein JCM10292_004987 [Rhodotorula paludigena]|uniref:uncharacterized protein n=1 Tax=Rhodotorula paludigena TaxID=86838 RepID=UPI00317D1453